jgi:hypothetical protein
MVDPRRRLLLYELELQCGFALKAYGKATAALGRNDRDSFWYAVQALLDAAANLHGFLSADAALRSALGAPDNSPLLRPELTKLRGLAAVWADWVTAHRREPLRLTNFGPHGVSDADPSAFGRFIDVERSVCVVFGIAFDIAQLMAAVAALRQTVNEELRRLREVV